MHVQNDMHKVILLGSRSIMMFPQIDHQQLCDESDVEKLKCPICHDLFKDPKCHGPCGHYLCDSCWLQCLHACNGFCPICRCVLDNKLIRWDQGMIMYMSSVQIKCAFQRCFWKGKLEDYEDHLKECAAKELGNVQQNAEMTKTLDKQKLVIADLKKKVRDGMAIQASQKRSIGNLYQLLVSKGKEARELLATIKIKDKKNGKLLLEKKEKRHRSRSRVRGTQVQL